MEHSRPYFSNFYEDDTPSSHELAFIAIGVMGVIQFDWDEHNRTKISTRHKVDPEEVEKAIKDRWGFLGMNHEYREVSDLGRMLYGVTHESRHILYNQRSTDRFLKVVFTLRMIHEINCVRPISSHYVNDKVVYKNLGFKPYNGLTSAHV